jgi:hypothetical protein
MNLPFKHPRPNKPKDIFRKETIETLGIPAMSERETSDMSRHGEVLRWSSESEEDTQLQSTRHRKDNSAWGKRTEKELAAIEKRAADKTKPTSSECSNHINIEEGSDDERPIVQTLNKGQPKFGLLSIGTEIMRQFETGLFIGTVKSYDKKEDLYVIEYSDGDAEEYAKEEYIYAY